ncbi:MAG: hypothetical protein JNK45_06775 [Myxococcales bacterium]|nr:hypothetical protein [Myxococcales bacterium]
MRRSPVPHAIALALLLASTLAACSGSSAMGADTEMIACSHLRCDNPNPSNCACPDDTDGVITNTLTESLPDPETTSASSTTDGPTTSSTGGSSSTGADTTTSSSTSTSTGVSESSTGTESSGDGSSSTDTGTGSESGSSGPVG